MQAVLLTVFVLIIIAALLAVIIKAMPIDQGKRVVSRIETAWRWCWRNAQELFGIPLALLVFWWSGYALRWLEPNSAIYDAGVLQGITVVVCHLLVGNSLARFGARVNIGWFKRNTSTSILSREWLFVIYLAAYCSLAALL